MNQTKQSQTKQSQDKGQVLPDRLPAFDLPFYYGAFTNLGIDYLVSPDVAKNLLRGCAGHEALAVAEFDGQACLSFNYQLYFGQFSNGGAVIQEIEFNIVSYPEAVAHQVPELSYERYAEGEDSTGRLGFCRYRVACDSTQAIDAGVTLFGEPKFKAEFTTTIPVPNGTPVQGPKGSGVEGTQWYDTWTVTCLKEDRGSAVGKETKEDHRHFTFTADLRGLSARSVSTAPFTEYGTRGKGSAARVLAAPLNVFQPYQWYDLAKAQGRPKEGKRVTLTPGTDPDHRIKSFLDALAGKEPVGAWLFQSPPVAAQNRPYYVPTVTK